MTPDRLSTLHAAAFAPERGWTAQEFRALLASPGTRLLTEDRAFLLGRVIADEAEILTLATCPSARRAGLARAMLRRFVELAGGLGAARILLDVAADNAAAQALYLGEGFTQLARRPRYFARPGGPPADAIVMQRDA